MLTQRQLFLANMAQTSGSPLGLEVERAEGVCLHGANGEKYLDLISGIAVSNIGHCHPRVVKAVQEQVEKHMHLMVYGEYIQSPQVKLAKLLSEQLPPPLSCSYFVNSGAEAIEGAMKLAKRYTRRTEIISFRNAYHGSTQGALSVMGHESLKNAYRPLLPEIRILDFNVKEQLKHITRHTAAVIVETIQGEAGVVLPQGNYLQELAERCRETGTLLVADEVQCGFGRTGSLFAFEQYGFVPDILCLAKGMGGGMPVGAFISSVEIMAALKENPALGHITTFGGHPVCCAAAHACLEVILQEKLCSGVQAKEKLFRQLLQHASIREIRGKGLLLALQFDSFEQNKRIIDRCLAKGVITDWFLFCDSALRIAPPLTISESEIETACRVITDVLNS